VRYAQDIATATQEIFSSMVMLEVSPGEPFKRADSKLINSISGIIGLAGEVKGMLAIHLPDKAAQEITTAFLGMDVNEIDEDVDIIIVLIYRTVGEKSRRSVTKLEFRTHTDMDVLKIAKFYGGGGHKRASGASVGDIVTVPEILKTIELLYT